MAKILKVADSNYKVSVVDGGKITLDTGPGTGDVYITGNLYVEGVTTSIETVNTQIEDNIILLNNGEAGSGIQRDSGTAGIQVDRGNYADAYWVFDEKVTWTDTQSNDLARRGAWSPRWADGRVLGIEVVSISTPNVNLNLLGRYNAGATDGPNQGKVTVSGVGGDYHTRMTEDNDIPNKKYVDLSIQTFFDNTVPNRIESGELPDATTKIQVYDNSDPNWPGASKADVDIDGITKASFQTDYLDLYGLRVEDTDLGTEIKTVQTSEQNLILSALGTGSVIIRDNINIPYTPYEGEVTIESTPPQDGVTVYTKLPNAGGSGIYFVNTNVVTNDGDNQRDELISRNRALVYSMLF